MINVMTTLSGNVNKDGYRMQIPTTVSVTPMKFLNSTAAAKVS